MLFTQWTTFLQITVQPLLGALIAGALLLFPSYYYLFRIFKAE